MQVAHDRIAASFARRAQLASLMLLGCVSLVCAADKAAQMSDDFLEYLGSLEGSEDTWVDFAEVSSDAAHESAKSEMTAKDSKTVIKAGSSSSASVTTKAAFTTTGKADK